jgi:hypothetical protein
MLFLTKLGSDIEFVKHLIDVVRRQNPVPALMRCAQSLIFEAASQRSIHRIGGGARRLAIARHNGADLVAGKNLRKFRQLRARLSTRCQYRNRRRLGPAARYRRRVCTPNRPACSPSGQRKVRRLIEEMRPTMTWAGRLRLSHHIDSGQGPSREKVKTTIP